MSNNEKSKDQVYVVVATNKPDVLDDAITRSGRFGNVINVGMPDVDGCKKILDIYTKNKPISDDFDSDKFAEQLKAAEAVGADISKIVTDAHNNAKGRNNIFEKMRNKTITEADMDGVVIEPVDFKKALEEFVENRELLKSKEEKIVHRTPGFLSDFSESSSSQKIFEMPVKVKTFATDDQNEKTA